MRPGASWLLGLVLLAAGCSAVRLAYDHAPALVYWQLDEALELTPAQTTRVRQAVDDWFAWHRAQALPAYLTLLRKIRFQLGGEVSGQEVCAWRSAFTAHLVGAFDAALPMLAILAADLGPAQIAHLAGHFEASDAELRAEYGSGSLEARLARSRKRTERFFKRLYGKLTPAQRDYILAHTAATAFDPVRWLDERRQRQASLLAGLTALAVRVGDESDREMHARQLLQHQAGLWANSPRADYQAYRERLLVANCALFAGVHARAGPAQRARADARLAGWEQDLRALSGPAESASRGR